MNAARPAAWHRPHIARIVARWPSWQNPPTSSHDKELRDAFRILDELRDRLGHPR
jgi:hypothetical protein